MLNLSIVTMPGDSGTPLVCLKDGAPYIVGICSQGLHFAYPGLKLDSLTRFVDTRLVYICFVQPKINN